jgi:hypothetical protein
MDILISKKSTATSTSDIVTGTRQQAIAPREVTAA